MKRKATLIRVFGYLLQHKGRLAFILSLSFLGNLLALAGPRLSGAAINLIAEGMDGSMDLPGVYKYAFFMLLFYIAKMCIRDSHSPSRSPGRSVTGLPHTLRPAAM